MPDSRPSPDPDPDAKYSVEGFKILSGDGLAPEDDPAEWIYPEEPADEARLRKIAEEIATHDDALAGILSDAAIGDIPTSEILRRVCAWQAMLGGSAKHGSNTPRPPQPWLA